MEDTSSAILRTICFLLLVNACASTTPEASNAKPIREIWKAYVLVDDEQSIDTASTEGFIIKEKSFDENGKVKTLAEYPEATGVYKKLTTFDDSGKIITVETYYDKEEKYGMIEETVNDQNGNPIKKVVSNIKNGGRSVVASLTITNEYNGAYLVKSVSSNINNPSERYITNNIFNANGDIESSILTDNAGKIISEVNYSYNNKKLVHETLSFHDVKKIKDIEIEYVGDQTRIETEKVNGKLHRVSEFHHENGHLVKILVNEVKRNRRLMVFVELKF